MVGPRGFAHGTNGDITRPATPPFLLFPKVLKKESHTNFYCENQLSEISTPINYKLRLGYS